MVNKNLLATELTPEERHERLKLLIQQISDTLEASNPVGTNMRYSGRQFNKMKPSYLHPRELREEAIARSADAGRVQENAAGSPAVRPVGAAASVAGAEPASPNLPSPSF